MSVTHFTADERQAIEAQWMAPHLIVLPLGIFGIIAVSHGWPSYDWGWQAFWMGFTAYMFLCWGSALHECAHQTLSGSRRLSIFLGRLLGAFMWVPYTAYRETHIRHHAYLNTPGDWELWPYSDPNRSKTFRRVFVAFDLILGAYVTAWIYGRIFFHRNSPIVSPAKRRAIRWEYLGSIVLWTALVVHFYVRRGAWITPMVRPIFVPILIAGSLQTLRKLTEHLGMKSYDPLLGTRTVIGRNPITRLFSFLNFEIFIHGPHHRHPRLTHNQLEGRMLAYGYQSPRNLFPVYRTYLSAVLVMLPHLFKNPGVGMNVGAPASEAKVSECGTAEFAYDMTEVSQYSAGRVQRATGSRSSHIGLSHSPSRGGPRRPAVVSEFIRSRVNEE